MVAVAAALVIGAVAIAFYFSPDPVSAGAREFAEGALNGYLHDIAV